MGQNFTTAIAAAAFALGATYANAASFNNETIDARANIYLGSPTAPAPASLGIGDGQIPTIYTFAAGADQALTFSSVTGGVTPAVGRRGLNGPDGDVASFDTDVDAAFGFSGIVADQSLFLAGVFFDSAAFDPTAPTALNYLSGAASTTAAEASPLLNQVFYIGDGLTGTGSGDVQSFLAPETADSLVLGFIDGFSFQGAPGFFNDNDGSLTASFSISAVPLPAPLFMLLAGLFGLGAMRRFTKAA